jgi:hypothetical protein
LCGLHQSYDVKKIVLSVCLTLKFPIFIPLIAPVVIRGIV